jgi:hypothetical protein
MNSFEHFLKAVAIKMATMGIPYADSYFNSWMAFPINITFWEDVLEFEERRESIRGLILNLKEIYLIYHLQKTDAKHYRQ